MSDKPILFSAPMVRAIIREIEHPGEGKTQTRRVLKQQPRVMPEFDEMTGSWLQFDGDEPVAETNVPYATGDRLWVRETWQAHGNGIWTIADARRRTSPNMKIVYKADGTHSDDWWPSIHMPREFSRITLTVTNVRVQRLQQISPEDVKAEGVEIPFHHIGDLHDPHRWKHDHFRPLWDGINGKRVGRSWRDNPWVVAVSFRPELRNIDARKPYDQAPTDPHHGGKIWA